MPSIRYLSSAIACRARLDLPRIVRLLRAGHLRRDLERGAAVRRRKQLADGFILQMDWLNADLPVRPGVRGAGDAFRKELCVT